MNNLETLMLSWKDTEKKNKELDLFFKKEQWLLTR